MLRHDQFVGYIDRTLAPDEAAGLEAILAAEPAAVKQLAEFAQYDSVLRTLARGAEERASIEESVLARIEQTRGHDSAPRAINPEATMNDPKQETELQDNARRTNKMFEQGLAPEKKAYAPEPTPAPAPEGQHADKVSQDLLDEQMRYQGVDTSRSPSKSEQVAKELREEATWGEKKSPDRKPEPAPEQKEPEQDNDYYHGMSP